MEKDTEENKHYLYPGGIFADKVPHKVTTILGSCVAVCLWDPTKNYGGINHYLLPFWNGEGLSSPRYGNISIPKLIEQMTRMGCRIESLKAKVFGGASMQKNSVGLLNVGERNAVFAVEYLKEIKIPILSSDLGGNQGRKLIFNTETGGVLMKKLNAKHD